jgi:hypothetical protein
MKATHSIAFILVIIGGLNWGLVGLGVWFGGNWNVIDNLLGAGSTLSSIIYVLVGLSALVLVFTHRKTCKMCESNSTMAPKM